MLERTVERKFVDAVKRGRGRIYKFVSPGRRGVPDRIVIYPIPPEHRELINSYIQFVELKAPGKKPRPEQLREHARLKRCGINVRVVDR